MLHAGDERHGAMMLYDVREDGSRVYALALVQAIYRWHDEVRSWGSATVGSLLCIDRYGALLGNLHLSFCSPPFLPGVDGAPLLADPGGPAGAAQLGSRAAGTPEPLGTPDVAKHEIMGPRVCWCEHPCLASSQPACCPN